MTAADIADKMQISVRSAYRIMVDMPHLPRPLRVREQDLNAWITAQIRTPGEEVKKPGRGRPKLSAGHIPRRRS